jgi:hypothetical protein
MSIHSAHISLLPFAAALALAAAACGGGDDPGTGSGTLLVDADVEATPVLANASRAADFTTELHVRVTKNGAAVTTGSVSLTSDGGRVDLVYDPSDRDGRWRGLQAGYHEHYQLDVVSGDDYVRGVQLDGPDLHVFTAPAATGAVDATVPVTVRWSRGDAADAATIETRELDRVAIDDTGSYELPVGALRSRDDRTEEEEIRLVRIARIVPAGAVAGSQLRVRVENRLPLVIASTGG